MTGTTTPSRTHRGPPALVWAAATFALLFSLSFHYVERHERPAMEKAMRAREARRSALGYVNVSRAVRPMFRDLMQTRSIDAVKAQISPQYVERFLKAHGKVVWQSQTFPLAFVFVDPATRYEFTVTINDHGSLAAHGTGSLFERIEANRASTARRAQFQQLTSTALWVTIAGIVVGVIAFRRPWRWLYELTFIAAMITIALHVTELTYSGTELTTGIDEYPWLLLAAGVLWYAWAKRHAWEPVAGRCAACDYDLTGNVSGVCPECGTPVPAEPIEVVRDASDVRRT